jgi:hypothetical protein
MLVIDDLHKRRSRTNIRGDARSGVCQRGVDLMVPVVVGWYRMLASGPAHRSASVQQLRADRPRATAVLSPGLDDVVS